MSQVVPVNTGTGKWPSREAAHAAVARMQAKLHRWAGDDASRRFGDLFNLVCDPAFLLVAWDRVARSPGARSAGADGVTVTQITRDDGAEAFLGQIRRRSKSGRFELGRSGR